MPAQHQALDWLARRHAGESAALIASRAGVSESTVLSATKAYGPFPRPSQQLGRTTVTDEHHRQRVQDWIEQRRRGRSTAEIAREYGVSHQIVSRSTLGHGPFPSEDTVAVECGWRPAANAAPCTTSARSTRYHPAGSVTTPPHPVRSPHQQGHHAYPKGC